MIRSQLSLSNFEHFHYSYNNRKLRNYEDINRCKDVTSNSSDRLILPKVSQVKVKITAAVATGRKSPGVKRFLQRRITVHHQQRRRHD
jgi:hypothetical protein